MGRSVILMATFVKAEDTVSYEFALRCFSTFGYHLPLVVMTDQDRALRKALQIWNSKHLYCVYHIYRNVEKNIAKNLRKYNKQFLRDFSDIQRIDDRYR